MDSEKKSMAEKTADHVFKAEPSKVPVVKNLKTIFN